MIPSLFALYSVLNDDDHDIRKLASESISTILNTQLVPQAATSAFAEHLLEVFIDSQIFIKYVCAKMTGTPISSLDMGVNDSLALLSVQDQYFEANPVDKQLFAQEKQNLWLDEIADTKIWASIFGKLRATSFEIHSPRSPLHPVIRELVAWVEEAVTTLKKSATTKEGALGWTTKPEVFAVSMRAIHAINAVMDYLEEHFLPAIDGDLAGWSSTGTDLLNQYDSIIYGIEELVGRCLVNEFHPILIQTLMSRQSQRPDIRNRFEVLHQRVNKLGQTDVNDLTFPLSNGTTS